MKTNLSPEEEFYSSYAATTPCSPTNITANEFQYGTRYYLCNKSLSLNLPARKKLMTELGCGNGQKLLWLKDKHGFQNAVGLDLGFSCDHKIEASVFTSHNLNKRWPFEDGEVDVLMAMMVFEHLFDPFFCFREIARVLDVNGRAFVNLPLITSIKNRLRLMVGLIPITSVSYSRWEAEGHWDGFHLHYFNLSSIHDLATSAGLSVVALETVGGMKRLKDLMPTLLCGEISFEVRKQSLRASNKN